MDGDFWISLVMRWLHVGSALVGLGAIVAVRFVLLPALRGQADGEGIYDRVRPVLKTVVHSALGLAILTGFYNYVVVSIPAVREKREAVDAVSAFAAYHPVMGLKIILSLALFGIGAMLIKPVPAFHEKRDTWYTVGVVLGFLVLLAGAFMRRLWNL